MSETQSRTNPLIITAAIAVIVFSAVGVGVMTGIIPSSVSKSTEVQAPTKSDIAKTEPAQKKAATPAPKKTVVAEAPKRTTTNEPARVASASPAAPRVCADCGSVEAVNVIEQKGEGSGLGAVAGGVAGALLGNQVGGGSGRKIATVAGAAGGAYAGHQIEKHVKSTKRYDVVVRMEDGSVRNFPYDSEPAFRAGARVKVVEGALVPN
jgi:outer membrane lipoprotein SlyB